MRNKLTFLSAFAIAIIFTLTGSSVNAVWNGTPALGDKRAVALFMFSDPRATCGASAFLYSPRIVFTAAHNLFAGDDRKVEHTENILRKSLWVGYPGEKLTLSSKRIESEKIFYPKDYKGRDYNLGGNRITRNNDFAVLVLKEPLPVDDKKVELLTPELHESFIQNSEIVDSVGYGAQSASELNACPTDRTPMKYQSVVTSKTIDVGNQVWTATLNLKSAPGKPSGCDGDSGAGFYKEYPDHYLYLGATGAGAKDFHNCASWQDGLTKEGIMGAWPVYLYLDLVKEAEDYVKANPYVAPVIKKSIICKKGKKKRFVTSDNPKCPKGFKLIAN